MDVNKVKRIHINHINTYLTIVYICIYLYICMRASCNRIVYMCAHLDSPASAAHAPRYTQMRPNIINGRWTMGISKWNPNCNTLCALVSSAHFDPAPCDGKLQARWQSSHSQADLENQVSHALSRQAMRSKMIKRSALMKEDQFIPCSKPTNDFQPKLFKRIPRIRWVQDSVHTG